MTRELENIVESIIFASPEGASTKEITRCVRGAVVTARAAHAENADEAITRFADTEEAQVVAAIAHLNAIYEETGRAFWLVERPAGWRIMSRPDFSPWVRELFPDKKPARLTPSALETLAIIAYRQPMTKSSIEAVRGVSVDGPITALMDRNVIRIAGRADLPGRPLLYETTDVFLEHFGIKTVDELPNAAELRSVKLPEPETALTVPTPEPQTELPLEGTEGAAPAPATEAPPAKGKKKGKSKKAAAAEAAAEVAVAAAVAGAAVLAGDSVPAEVPTAGAISSENSAPEAEWSPAEDEPELELEPEVEVEAEAGDGTQVEAEAEAENDFEAAPETEVDTEPEFESEREPDPEPDPEISPEADFSTDGQAEPEPLPAEE
jgi:segregation and condensation protein B